jgi:hypothetical protein
MTGTQSTSSHCLALCPDLSSTYRRLRSVSVPRHLASLLCQAGHPPLTSFFFQVVSPLKTIKSSHVEVADDAASLQSGSPSLVGPCKPPDTLPFAGQLLCEEVDDNGQAPIPLCDIDNFIVLRGSKVSMRQTQKALELTQRQLGLMLTPCGTQDGQEEPTSDVQGHSRGTSKRQLGCDFCRGYTVQDWEAADI